MADYTLNYSGIRTTIPDFTACLTGASLSNYNAATNGELVEIDSTSYNCLLQHVKSTAGANNAAMTGSFGAAQGVDSTNFITGASAIPTANGTANFVNGAVPFLLRLRVFGANSNQGSGRQLGFHTNVGTGTQAGTAISSKSVTRTAIPSDANAFVYYVVKNPSVIISGTDKMPRIFAGNNSGNPQGIRYASLTGWSMYQSASGGVADVTRATGGGVSASFAVAIQVHSL